MKRILIILTLLIGVAQAQSKAGFYVVGGKIITVQDTASRKYLKAIENEGVVPSVLQNMASNFLVTSEKAIGSYSLITAQYPMMGGTAATHKFNLNNPNGIASGFTLTYGGTVTHSANGMQGDGSTGFARPFINPSVIGSISTSNFHYHINVFQKNTVSTGFDFGAAQGGLGTPNNGLIRTIGTGSELYASTGAFDAPLISNALGSKYQLLMTRTLSTQARAYLSSIKSDINTIASGGFYNAEIAIFSQNNLTGGLGFASNPSNAIINYFSIGAGLTDAQALSQSRIVTFYNSLLGR